jgi:hypothetical protein
MDQYKIFMKDLKMALTKHLSVDSGPPEEVQQMIIIDNYDPF